MASANISDVPAGPEPMPSSEAPLDWNSMTRFQRFYTPIIREPLVPLGTAATVWAIIEATRSIKKGDSYRTNRMFRYRIYAQGFTLLCVVAGSVYYKEEHRKHNILNKALKDAEAKEKTAAWIRELEARQESDEKDERYDEEIKGRREVLKELERRASRSKTQAEIALKQAEQDKYKPKPGLTQYLSDFLRKLE